MTDTVDPNQLQSVIPAEVTDVPKDTREKVGGVLRGLVGSQGGSLDQLIAKHHQERLDQANMHRRTAAAAMAAYSYGIDPETGNPLTPGQEQKYLNEWNASMEQFTKVAGVNKETKAAILRNKQLIEGMAQQRRRQQQQRGGPPQPPAMAGVPGEQ